MNKDMCLIIGVAILLVLLCIAPTPVSFEIKNNRSENNLLNGNTWYVGGSGPGNFSKIQDAIDNCSNGDTVFVYSGSYFENILINKSISLIGQNKSNTIIQGRKNRDVVTIVASNVLVENFVLNTSELFISKSGVKIYSDINNIKIKNNKITNNFIGISIGEEYFYDEITHVTIENNFIQNDRNGVVLNYGFENTISNNTFIDNGIFIPKIYTRDITVKNNTVNGLPLIYLDKQSDKIIESNVGQIILVNCDNITVTNQYLDKKCFIGIELLGCTNCNIFKNSISNKAWSIFSLYSDNNNIQENTLENNSLTIYLKDSDRHTISFNTVNNSLNSVGLYHSNHNTISHNTLTNSRTAIDLSHASDNIIIQNKINSTRDHGIDLFYECSRNKILNNTIINCGDAGIFIEGKVKVWWDFASILNVISGNEITNNEWGILLEKAALSTVSSNNICQNYYGVEVISANFNKIFNNNIFENKIEDAFFKNSLSTRFYRNYWNETKRFHKINGGFYTYSYWSDSWELIFRFFRFDWNPVELPYDIGV